MDLVEIIVDNLVDTLISVWTKACCFNWASQTSNKLNTWDWEKHEEWEMTDFISLDP